MKRTYMYKNIFMYASLQFCGHIDEYFISRTEKLVIFLVMPRLKNTANILRYYQCGRLVREQVVWSSSNFILYYFSWYLHYIYSLLYFFRSTDKIIVLSGHPISLLGMSIQKIIRNIVFVYWVGDYFPPANIALKFYEKLKKHYHDCVSIRYYLSDQINKKLNGRILNSSIHRTIMWGIKPIKVKRYSNKKMFSLLFVGLINKSQGLEFLFTFLKNHREYKLSVIGICDDKLYAQYQKIIANYHIEKRVFFPNKFYSDLDLQKLARNCHVGVAMYEASNRSSTFYTDPGKVKSYAELGLPIIMSDTSAVAPYIKRFRCGLVVQNTESEFVESLIKMKQQYKKFQKGLRKFQKFFYYTDYYARAFHSLESI